MTTFAVNSQIHCVLRVIAGASVRRGNEKAMQEDVENLLTLAGVEFAREVTLSSNDRIDFLCGGVGIECKVGGSRSAIADQLQRYARSSRVEGLILLTTRHTHARGWPVLISGKPFTVSFLWGPA